jgi:hypothetical protein
MERYTPLDALTREQYALRLVHSEPGLVEAGEPRIAELARRAVR